MQEPPVADHTNRASHEVPREALGVAANDDE
jgi:hypothetical protein